MLARRSHSSLEVERALARTVDLEVARGVVAELEAASLLDDGRYAQELVAYRLKKGWGPHRIRFDLEQAGVDRDLARELVDAIDDESLANARRVAVGVREGVAAVRRLSARGF
jgi:regulatory protein